MKLLHSLYWQLSASSGNLPLVLFLSVAGWAFIEFADTFVPVLSILNRGWPLLGVALGVTLVLTQLGATTQSTDSVLQRLYRWLPLLFYIIHQFEEHAVDILGRRYAFRASLCQTVSPHLPLENCPATEKFIFVVNAVAVWVALYLAARSYHSRVEKIGTHTRLLSPSDPALWISSVGIMAVNVVSHLVHTFRFREYGADTNAELSTRGAADCLPRHRRKTGLLTAVVLFLPFSVYVYATAIRDLKHGGRFVVVSLLAGVFVHAILFFSLVARLHGVLSDCLLDFINAINALSAYAVFIIAKAIGFLPAVTEELQRGASSLKLVD